MSDLEAPLRPKRKKVWVDYFVQFRWIPLFETFDNLLHILIMFLLTRLIGLPLRSYIPKVCKEINGEGDGKDHKNNKDPSKLNKIVHPNLLPLRAQGSLEI